MHLDHGSHISHELYTCFRWPELTPRQGPCIVELRIDTVSCLFYHGPFLGTGLPSLFSPPDGSTWILPHTAIAPSPSGTLGFLTLGYAGIW